MAVLHANSDATALLVRAADFAARKHRGQRRKNGDIPYINHPLGVALNLVDIAGISDGATLAAAILHDTVEDTETTLTELTQAFGEEIAGLVAELTDDKTIPKAERKRLQIQHAKTMSERARLVKLADKLYNLRDLATCPPTAWGLERIRGYFCWAWFVVSAAGDVNEALQGQLAELFDGSIDFDGASHRLLPTATEDRAELLERYYEQMRVTD